MRSHSDSVKQVKNQIAALGKEIDYYIDRLEKLPNEMDNNCQALRRFVEHRQDELEAQFRKAYMVRGEDVWEYIWKHIGEMVEEFQQKAAKGHRYTFPELEADLKTRRTSLGRNLKLNAMWADQVWQEVWAAVWQVIQHEADAYRHEAMAEFERCGKELDPLLARKAVLKQELEGLQSAEEGIYKMLKSTFNSRGKSRP